MNHTTVAVIIAGGLGLEWFRQAPGKVEAPRTPPDDSDPEKAPADAGTTGALDGDPPPGAATGDPPAEGAGGLINPFEERRRNPTVPAKFQGIGAIAKDGAESCFEPPIGRERRPMTRAEVERFRRSRGILE